MRQAKKILWFAAGVFLNTSLSATAMIQDKTPVDLWVDGFTNQIEIEHTFSWKMDDARLLNDFMPVDLRTDYRETPLGIDRLPPVLSWRIEAGNRKAAAQSAYRIQAASSHETLVSGNQPYWDTGKIHSDGTTHIQYAGPSPASCERIWWRVKVWDEDGRESPWSAPTWFETGLLEENDWQGSNWIGSSDFQEEPIIVDKEFLNARWISADPEIINTLQDQITFFTDITLGPDDYPVEAFGYWAVKGWPGANSNASVNGESSLYMLATGELASRTDFAEKLVPGKNSIQITIKPPRNFNGAVPQALDAIFAMRIYLGDGSTRDVISDDQWKIRSSKEAMDVIPGQIYNEGKVETVRLCNLKPNPAIWLKYPFACSGRVESARLYLSGLGYSEAFVNGQKVGDAVLDPGFTDYEDWALYQAHDVTGLVKKGSNVWAVHLGNGFYHYPLSWGARQHFSSGQPGVRGLLVIQYKDGSREIHKTDEKWYWKNSPYIQSDVFIGEHYDGRQEIKDLWTSVVSKDWKKVDILPARSPRLKNQDFPPIRKIREIVPVDQWQVAPETWLFDLGENIAGWTKLQFDEPVGKTIRIRVTEDITGDRKFRQIPGSFWKVHGMPQHHQIISTGEGPFTWEPRFIYHGFRYAEVSGLSKPPGRNDLTGVVIHTDAGSAATFTSSDTLLNRIFEACMRTQYNNMHSILQDCPTREKGMWGADSYVASQTGLQGIESASFYRQQIRLWFTGPQPEGLPLDLGVGLRRVPYVDIIWSIAPLRMAFQLWKYHGDLETVREFYPQMKYFIVWHEQNSPDLIPERHKIGDHATPQFVPRVLQDRELMGAQTFYNGAKQFSEMAAALGKNEDATWAAGLAERIRQVIIDRWYDADNKLLINSTHQSLGLDYGIIPEKDWEEAGDKLASIFRDNGYRFDAGIIGYRIYPVLSRYGATDVALNTLLNTDYPGIARSIIRDDATTIWERFIDDQKLQYQRSYDHPAFTSVAQWMLQDLAGIQPDPQHPGFQSFLLRPSIANSLEYVEATTLTAFGTIRSAWKKQGEGTVAWDVVIPANSNARLFIPIPVTNRSSVTVNGQSTELDEDGSISCLAGTYRIIWAEY